MFRLHQTSLLVCISDTGEVCANHLKVGVEAGVIGGHLEHAQVKEGDGREGTAGNQDQRGALAVFDSAPETAGREFVLVHSHVAANVVGHFRRVLEGLGGRVQGQEAAQDRLVGVVG